MKSLPRKYPVIMCKGTNAVGKSLFPLMLRKKGWKEKVVKVADIKFTKFRRKGKTVFVLGKYGDKGGGCDGLSKDEMLKTLNYLWDRKGAIYFEGQNIADTLTTHPLWMLKLNGKKNISFEKSARGTLPDMDVVPERKRYIYVVCLEAPLDVIMQRLAARTPGKVLKANGLKTKQKYQSVKNQLAKMLQWKETMKKDILVRQHNNTGTKKELFNYFKQLCGV